ncbi:MAG TPA: rubrerythrin family protein [Myxococcota bacterium]|nr:rubrerythrin family protein [Myxococcota bacterium]HRY94191.1 rubrerythrin family protein [Myxococcota bacterium]HSA23930.1 rubrerythrin family protein [Myxococcota bacterium]
MPERTRTEENLYKAYVGEAKASVRLLAYAEQAARDGYPQMAHLFRAVAAAERVHALKHLRLMKAVGSTEENLARSFEREATVSENYYKEFIQVAEEEGARAAVVSFGQARDAEEFHGKLYKGALEHMQEERDTRYHVCSICGYVADGDPPESCPVCNAPRDKFFPVE